MKKFISICLCFSILCGCGGGMRGLQRQSTQNLHKIIDSDYELYWNDKEGHNNNVKMIKWDDYKAQIKIPVEYIENIEQTPQKLPNIVKRALDNLNTIQCNYYDASIDKNFLTINTKYHWDNNTDKCFYTIIFGTLLFPITIFAFFSDKDNVINIFQKGCSKTLNSFSEEDQHFRIYIPWSAKELEEIGIKANITITPEDIFVSCNKKSCSILDMNNQFINKITIVKNISFNENKLDELLKKEKKEQEEFEKLEKQRKAEEAKKKEEEDRKWREKRKLQKKECPGLYRTLYWAQQTGYIDPIVGLKTAQRFDELGCVFWLQEQTNGY